MRGVTNNPDATVGGPKTVVFTLPENEATTLVPLFVKVTVTSAEAGTASIIAPAATTPKRKCGTSLDCGRAGGAAVTKTRLRADRRGVPTHPG